MKPRQALCVLLGVVLAGAVLWAGDPWNDKPYTEWDRNDVDRILGDSPWAKSVAVAGSAILGAPVQGSTGKIEHSPSQASAGDKLIVRWFSALTLREALFRSNQLRRTVSDEGARRLLSNPPAHFVVQVVFRDYSGDAFLEPVDRPFDPNHPPASLELAGSKQRIHAIKWQALGESEVYFFPRAVGGNPVLLPGENRVKFHFEVGDSHKSVTFDLRKMTRQGQPDL